MADESAPQSPARVDDESLPPLVVGLGASAGGVKALRDFFSHVPTHSGAAYIVVLHLSPDYESKLAEVLQATAAIPVVQVREPVTIEQDHVYVIPPNRSLTVVDGRVVLSQVVRAEQRRAPVDIFFRTLADAHGSRAAVVVLSGTGPNGSSGLKRVKEYGGLTIVQDPKEAEYSDMPTNSIATGLVDYVLPVAAMPAKIIEYSERLRASQREVPLAMHVDNDAAALRDILTVLRIRTGHDFTNYKPATVFRRIERRINLRGFETLADYARYIGEKPDEAVALMKELLISVTNFFRDADAFAALERDVIPALFAGKQAHDQVRVWVAGCATGEEAYSIAMLLAEHGSGLPDGPAVQVFATDLDEQAIAAAREGVYTEAEVADVSEERLHRFFQLEEGGYRIRRDLRELVLFAHHNVIKDPPFSRLDLLSCRNLLIYLNRSIQARLIATFHFSLRAGGYLFLGTSESPDGLSELFSTVDASARIYHSRQVGTRLVPISESGVTIPTRAEAGSLHQRSLERIVPVDLHHQLLEQYAPPSLVVTDDFLVVHVSDRAVRYLQLSPGEPSRDVLKLVIPDLRLDLRTALQQAARERSNVEVRGITLSSEHGGTTMSIQVRPVPRETGPTRGYFLVLFDEDHASPGGDVAVRLTSPTAMSSREAEEELGRLRTDLRATIVQYETQVEEARAANEELQAMNEELRAAAEELETGKEELQSVNEELTTVNQELKIKIEELALANNDFQNLITSTDIGTIFLDKTLRVKLSTPRAREVFNLLITDAGRPLSDITHTLKYEAFHDDAKRVLERLQSVEREVQSLAGRWYLMRILPYRTTDDRIDGVVMTFQDITNRIDAETHVRRSEERLRLLIDSAIDYAIFTMTSAGVVDSWNAGAQRLFGYSAEEVVGQNFTCLFTADDQRAGAPAEELARAARDGRTVSERWYRRKDGTTLCCSAVTTRLGDGDGLGYAKIARDLSPQHDAEESLRRAHVQLEERVRQRTSELREEIHHRTAAQEHATNLLRRLVTAQEDLRARIARDLHDELGQQLTALRLMLERQHAVSVSSANGLADLDHALALVREIDAELDFLAWELRPAALDDLGLAAALPRFVTQWSEHYGMTAEFRTLGLVAGKLSRDAELTFYRVAQEALNNVVKHAGASRVDVMLDSSDHSVVLIVEDDGVGFDSADAQAVEKGFGLVGMRERAALIDATLQIESAPGKGTAVYLRCSVPTSQEQEASS